MPIARLRVRVAKLDDSVPERSALLGLNLPEGGRKPLSAFDYVFWDVGPNCKRERLSVWSGQPVGFRYRCIRLTGDENLQRPIGLALEPGMVVKVKATQRIRNDTIIR